MSSSRPMQKNTRAERRTLAINKRSAVCASAAGARRGGGGDPRPDPAPFPADDRTPSPPADDRHSGQRRARNGRGRVRGERDRGSAMAIGPRTTGRGITAPLPVGRHWTVGRRRRRIGRVKRWAAAGSPAP